jgi:hypothetical protein
MPSALLTTMAWVKEPVASLFSLRLDRLAESAESLVAADAVVKQVR